MDKKYFLKLAILLGGNICAAFGVFLCISSGKGADPISVLLNGLMNTFPVSIGIAVIILHGILMIICYIFDRKSIKLGTILSIISFSISLDLFMSQLTTFALLAHLSFPWFMLLFGILFMGIGFSLGIFANIGCNTADIALNILSSKTNFDIKKCKWILDATYTIIGVILGGTIGLGTILCVLFVGTVYSTTLKILEKNFKILEQEQLILVNEN
ncbi:MAG: YitT family protein [Lachnospiraceae bacterium]